MDSTCEQEDHQLKNLPGFRFHPTEEELVGFYLRRKVDKKLLKFSPIQELDLYAYEPWDLPGLDLNGADREWFFFVKPRGHNDGRPNRITKEGFWKATGTDRPVYVHSTSTAIGLRKTLVFYRGRALKGHKTDWIMNEYRLLQDDSEKGGIRLCRVYKKANSLKSFDRRPLVQHSDKKDESNISNLDVDAQRSGLSVSSKAPAKEEVQATLEHSFGEYEYGEDGKSMVKGACKPKLEYEVYKTEIEDFTHLNSLEAWWCLDAGKSSSLDAICTNAVAANYINM
ncbi:hypothetical protein SUGI_0470880 [Cryptomeria japonica]|nr:hypothetical protein SUGI_0470880 [Cryptomeria japonica]